MEVKSILSLKFPNRNVGNLGLPLAIVLICYGWHNKVPHIGYLIKSEVYSLVVLEAEVSSL